MEISIKNRSGLQTMLALAALVLSLTVGSLGLRAEGAEAMDMPDWAAEFDTRGDAFEGGGGGGGGQQTTFKTMQDLAARGGACDWYNGVKACLMRHPTKPGMRQWWECKWEGWWIFKEFRCYYVRDV